MNQGNDFGIYIDAAAAAAGGGGFYPRRKYVQV